MTRVGIIGVGFMGMVHYLTYQKLVGAEVVALCDCDTKKLEGDWTGIQGNFGPPGEHMDLSKVTTYESADDLIADPNVDLVDITLPPAAHSGVAIAALGSGKHVFCEKPMAMTVGDCDRMAAAAKQASRKLMIGHVLPFLPEYAWALREIRSGAHGRPIGGSFKRVISDPAWLENYWDATAVGGPLLDLHVHDAHFIRLAFGMPKTVASRGSQRNGLPEHWHSLFGYDKPEVTVQVTGGTIRQAGRPFLHGFEIHLERATLVFEFAVIKNADGSDEGRYLCPPTLLNPQGVAQQVEMGDGDPMNAFYAELGHATQVVQGVAEPDMLACDLARDAIEICRLQADSLFAPDNPAT
ncbi:MAG: Gfo/Idh/MocA family oxidoreductase [Pirellulales bacterium]|nr:Gfo/Idh/MocA family oxidoreductase [Pirellulales bacterium]